MQQRANALMADVSIVRRPVAKPMAAPASGSKPVTVSTSAMAAHLDCTRAYIRKLEGEGVLHRAPDGSSFPLDQSRVAYLRFLRRERRQSPRGEAAADFQRAKSELLRLRISERQRQLIPLEEAISTTEEVIGLMLTHMSGMPARCGGRDLQLRRRIEQVIYETRVAMSEAANKLADQRGEPPLDDGT